MSGDRNPVLRASYDACRRINAAHGRSFYLATLLLPGWKRPYVHALYALNRTADDIVDDLDPLLTDAVRAERLAAWSHGFLRDLEAGAGGHPIAPAVLDTLRTWEVPLHHVEEFLASMRMDLTVASYETYEDLLGYMNGSAVAVALQMLPLLEPVVPAAVAAPYAADLGVAFQLTNFIRDVGEDLRRGRVYLPQEDLRAFGVTREHLERGLVDGPVRRLLAFEIERTREIYRSAQLGTRLLHPTSRHCVEVATALYAGILDAVERADYRVLDRRASVGALRRARVAVPGAARALAGRNGSHRGEASRITLRQESP